MQIDKEFIPFLSYIKDLNLINFLEIGTSLGGAFYALSQVIGGKAISIDLPNGTFGGIPLENMGKRNAILKKECKNTYFLAENSQNLDTVKRVESILKNEKLDLCFIDGDHTYPGVLLDFLLYKNLVKENGLIVFHDIKNTERHKSLNCNVSILWNQLKGKKKEFVDDLVDWGGIGIISIIK